MLSSFLSTGVQLIQRYNNDIPLPAYSKSSISTTGGLQHFLTAHMTFGSEPMPSEHAAITTLISFSILDLYIEKTFSISPGGDFKYRYTHFMNQYNGWHSIGGAYRCLRVLRNSFVHNMNGCTTVNDEISCSYTHRSKTESITLSKDSLKNLVAIAVLISTKKYSTRTQYTINLLYSNALRGIKKFTDSIGKKINGEPSTVKKFASPVRQVITNPDFFINENSCTIECSRRSLHERNEHIITIEDNTYVIPEEILCSGNKIDINAFSHWKIEDAEEYGVTTE